jgi:rubrerythrin
MIELNDFYNDGTGWTCRRCETELTREESSSRHSRAFVEGEAESRSPELENRALAKWLDKTQMQLICPRCGVVEAVEKF